MRDEDPVLDLIVEMYSRYANDTIISEIQRKFGWSYEDASFALHAYQELAADKMDKLEELEN